MLRHSVAAAEWSSPQGWSSEADTTTARISTIPFWYSLVWRFATVNQYPWGPYGYPPYRGYAWIPARRSGIEVKPKEAEVYVDGYYAGIVDDFDGTFQRLQRDAGRARDRALSGRLPRRASEGVRDAAKDFQREVRDGAAWRRANSRNRGRSR